MAGGGRNGTIPGHESLIPGRESQDRAADLGRMRDELLFSALRGIDGASSLAFTIFRNLAVGIVEGRLLPGHEVNSAELAREFNTSRTPVREALLMLEREDLVIVPPRRRPYVSAVALPQVKEIYEIRASLYGLVSELLVARAHRRGASRGCTSGS